MSQNKIIGPAADSAKGKASSWTGFFIIVTRGLDGLGPSKGFVLPLPQFDRKAVGVPYFRPFGSPQIDGTPGRLYPLPLEVF